MGHKTSLDKAESWLIRHWIIEVLLPGLRGLLKTGLCTVTLSAAFTGTSYEAAIVFAGSM